MASDFIDDFIQEYKNQPCLWLTSSGDFKNRKKRQEAYYKLIQVAAQHGEHYNIERTKQKINNLRCAFRQQLKRLTESKNNGDDSFYPKRRYFESLMFLVNEEKGIDKEKIITEINKSSSSRTKNDGNYTTVTINADNSNSDNVIGKNSTILSIRNDSYNYSSEQTDEDPDNAMETINQTGITTVTSAEKENDNFIETIKNSNNILKMEIHNDEVNIICPRFSFDSTTVTSSIGGTAITTTASGTTTTAPTTALTNVSTVSTIHSGPLSLNSTSNSNDQNQCLSLSNSTDSSINANTTNTSIPVMNSTAIQEVVREQSHQRAISVSSEYSTHSERHENPSKKIKIDCDSSNFEKLLNLACSRISSSDYQEDDYAVFGKMVSHKLRAMDPQQSVIAQKLIYDILWEGQLKLLSHPSNSNNSCNSNSNNNNNNNKNNTNNSRIISRVLTQSSSDRQNEPLTSYDNYKR